MLLYVSDRLSSSYAKQDSPALTKARTLFRSCLFKPKTVDESTRAIGQYFKKMKIALYQSQREIHTVATRTAPGDLGLKFHPKDYQQKFK